MDSSRAVAGVQASFSHRPLRAAEKGAYMRAVEKQSRDRLPVLHPGYDAVTCPYPANHTLAGPGGKRINKAAFATPTGPVQGSLARSTMRGFGATQVDLTLRRQFQLRERLSLQARADFFNLFNHPNFGLPTNYLTSPLFGQSNQMLGASLGSGGQNGGINPLYQIGGPRSAQLALKLVF